MYISLIFSATLFIGSLAQYDVKTATREEVFINEDIVELNPEDYYYKTSLRIIMDYLKQESLRVPGYKVIIRLTSIKATKQYVLQFQRYQYSFTFEVNILFECVLPPCEYQPTPVPARLCTVTTYVGPYGTLEIIGDALNCYYIEPPGFRTPTNNIEPVPIPIPVPDPHFVPEYFVPIPVKS